MSSTPKVDVVGVGLNATDALIHVKRFFSSSWYEHEKIGVAGDGERMYHARQFPTLSVPQNNSSCVVFRKEKDREFPPSSRLETYQLT